MPMALEGIKVIDLTRHSPGPFCTMVLGDLGADVLRVEQPAQQGERSSPRDTQQDRRAAAFNALNRNKRSIVLNLRHPEAQRVLHALCGDADVLVEGYRPGVVKRLGCDYETISALNPRIVYCSISGFGQTGPYQSLAGHDINYISVGDALGVIGFKDGPPAIPQNIIADYAAGGMHGAIGILGALMARERTGRGQYVDISMMYGVIYLMASMASEYFRNGTVPRRGETRLSGEVPYYGVYECGDGRYLSLGCIEPHFWEPLCRALGREEFIPHQHDEAKHPEIFAFFRETFKTRPRDEWVDFLSGAGDIAVARVYSIDEVFQDPQVQHREHPLLAGTLDGEPVRQPGIGPKLSDTPGSVRSLGPLTGEHTEEVLLGLGYTQEQVQGLMEQGAVT